MIKKKKIYLFDAFILKSWWVILFFLLCFFTYDQAGKRRDREELQLQTKYDQLLRSQGQAVQLQEELIQKIESQDDDYWLECVLMEKLGLVPEGQKKVHFIRRANCKTPVPGKMGDFNNGFQNQLAGSGSTSKNISEWVGSKQALHKLLLQELFYKDQLFCKGLYKKGNET